MPYLQTLATDPHDASQWLLYSGLAAAGVACASWAGEILAEGEHRLYSGYNEDAFWTTRELLLAVGDDLSASALEVLEGLILGLRAPWERAGRPLGQFTLLSALPEERLSPEARRRLGEQRRVFGSDQPSEPVGFIGGSLSAPVSSKVAAKLSDDAWMGVIEKHSQDVENWGTFTGGADEQAMVLEREAENDPERFAALAFDSTPPTTPSILAPSFARWARPRNRLNRPSSSTSSDTRHRSPWNNSTTVSASACRRRSKQTCPTTSSPRCWTGHCMRRRRSLSRG
jgi:hypothetical protein